MIEPLFHHPAEMLYADKLTDEAENRQLILYYTRLCNAECAHCIVDSGPRRRGRIDQKRARDAIRGAADIEGLDLVIFSGGESFIYLETVLELCRYAHEHGLKTRVVSNGYWARTPERAAQMLTRIAREGVDQLAISFDEFHLPFVDRRRVVNVFRGAQIAEELPFLVFAATLRPGAVRETRCSAADIVWPAALFDLLEDYGFAIEECVPRRLVRAQARLLTGDALEVFKARVVRERALINWNILLQGGRATRDVGRELPTEEIDQDAGGRCPLAGYEVTVPTSGRLYPCCSNWSNFGNSDFGTIAEPEIFAEQVASMFDDPLVRFIRKHGPGRLVRYLRRAGFDLPDRYSDICHMCEGLFSALPLEELRSAAEACDTQLAWARRLKVDFLF